MEVKLALAISQQEQLLELHVALPRVAYQVAGRGNGRVMLRQSKTKALVDIREFSELKKRLDAAQARRKLAKVVSSHVILDERSWTPFKPDHYRHVYDEVRRHAAKTMRSCATLRDQDLRDTAVTWLFHAGCTIGEICAITGHSLQTATQILEHYFARHPELADSAIDKVELWWTRGD